MCFPVAYAIRLGVRATRRYGCNHGAIEMLTLLEFGGIYEETLRELMVGHFQFRRFWQTAQISSPEHMPQSRFGGTASPVLILDSTSFDRATKGYIGCRLV